jgi:hypothetical protein
MHSLPGSSTGINAALCRWTCQVTTTQGLPPHPALGVTRGTRRGTSTGGERRGRCRHHILGGNLASRLGHQERRVLADRSGWRCSRVHKKQTGETLSARVVLWVALGVSSSPAVTGSRAQGAWAATSALLSSQAPAPHKRNTGLLRMMRVTVRKRRRRRRALVGAQGSRGVHGRCGQVLHHHTCTWMRFKGPWRLATHPGTWHRRHSSPHNRLRVAATGISPLPTQSAKCACACTACGCQTCWHWAMTVLCVKYILCEQSHRMVSTPCMATNRILSRVCAGHAGRSCEWLSMAEGGELSVELLAAAAWQVSRHCSKFVRNVPSRDGNLHGMEWGHAVVGRRWVVRLWCRSAAQSDGLLVVFGLRASRRTASSIREHRCYSTAALHLVVCGVIAQRCLLQQRPCIAAATTPSPSIGPSGIELMTGAALWTVQHMQHLTQALGCVAVCGPLLRGGWVTRAMPRQAPCDGWVSSVGGEGDQKCAPDHAAASYRWSLLGTSTSLSQQYTHKDCMQRCTLGFT